MKLPMELTNKYRISQVLIDEDYFYGEGVCLVEWADSIEEVLPEKFFQIKIEKDLEKGLNYRKIIVER